MRKKFFKSSTYYPFAANMDGEIKNTVTGNIRKQLLCANGYLYVGTRQGTLIAHRIVADSLIPNPCNLEQVNHKNGIKTDNRVENLEWCSRSHNMKHSADMGLLKFNGNYGEESNLCKHSDDLIHAVCADMQDGMRNVDVSKKYDIPASYIKDLRGGNSRVDITSKYVLKPSRKCISEETVRWICSCIADGKSNTEIFKLATSGSTTLAVIKNIKYGNAHRKISSHYF